MPQDRGVGLFVFSVRSHPSDLTYKVRRDGYAIAATMFSTVIPKSSRSADIERMVSDSASLGWDVFRTKVRRNLSAGISLVLAQFVCWCFQS